MFVQLVLEAAVLLFQQVVLFGLLVQVLLDVADWIHQFLDLLLVLVFRKLPSKDVHCLLEVVDLYPVVMDLFTL